MSNQVTTYSRPSTEIKKYFVNQAILFLVKYQVYLKKVWVSQDRNLWNQFLFPIFILRCWMIFHPLLKSESFTSSTIDHTFSKKRRDSAELIYFEETFTTEKIYICNSTHSYFHNMPLKSNPIPKTLMKPSFALKTVFCSFGVSESQFPSFCCLQDKDCPLESTSRSPLSTRCQVG